MAIDLNEMRKLAGDDLSEADLSWRQQKIYDKVKKGLGGKEKVPLSKMADVIREVVKRERDKYDAWDIVKLFIADEGDHFNAFKQQWGKAVEVQKAWEKEAAKKAEPAIHKHIDNALAAIEKADAEMRAATELANKSRSHIYSAGIPRLREFFGKPISGLKQLKKGDALGMYYSVDY